MSLDQTARSKSSQAPSPAPMNPHPDFRQVRMVIAKVTHSCNLKCSYCCANAIPLTQPGATMAMETHKTAVRLLAGKTCSEELQWIFHGGEPMLLPIPWYEEAIEFLIATCEANPAIKRLTIGMQSNLTRLTPEILQLVKKYKIQVGTSLDGPPKISDVFRQAGKRVEENIEWMMREDAPPGVIAQINRNAMANLGEVVEYFDRRGFAVMFNPTCPTGRGANVENLTGDELFQAKSYILERADKSGNLRILGPDLLRQLHWFVSRQRDMTQRSCHDYNCGAGISIISVNPNGDLWPCGRSSDADIGKLGNILEMESLANYQKNLTKFHEKDSWYIRCFGCEARLICLFGCTAFDRHSIPTREIECRATKLLNQFLCSRPGFAQRMVDRFRADMQKMSEKARSGKLPPPFLILHTGSHPCTGCAGSCPPVPASAATDLPTTITTETKSDPTAAAKSKRGAPRKSRIPAKRKSA